MPVARKPITRYIYKFWQLFTRRELSDEYVNWVCYANAGMLDRGNIYAFDYVLGHLLSAAPILEIGSFCGLSTNLITYYKQKHSVANALITCDKWEFENAAADGYVAGSAVPLADYRRLVRDSYLRNTALFSAQDLPYTVELLSDEFFSAWKSASLVNDVRGRSLQLGGALSFCYIDGNHSHEYVHRDYLNCHAYLEAGGFILFDDSADGSGWGVQRVIQEVKSSGQYKLILKNPNYLFQKLPS